MSMSKALICVWNGRAAAPPWIVWSVGVSTLEEAFVVEGVADRAHDGRPRTEHVAGLRPHDEVGVALPYAGLFGELLVEDG